MKYLKKIKDWTTSRSLSNVLKDDFADAAYEFVMSEIINGFYNILLNDLNIDRSEAEERCEEFNVFNNRGHLDLISLNSLYDFYQINFDATKFDKYLNTDFVKR